MRTLAKALGLSHTAVSKGLRNAPDISVAMREKSKKPQES
jgi:DNA-binding LacI/PurR family transcriptional regulator